MKWFFEFRGHREGPFQSRENAEEAATDYMESLNDDVRVFNDKGDDDD